MNGSRKLLFTLSVIVASTLSVFAQSDSAKATLKIQALDLSENMSRLSTKDDEVIVLLYIQADSGKTLSAPVFQSEFVLDSAHKEKIFKELSLTKSTYLLFILERDDERTLEQIDPIFRVYYSEISKLFLKKDWLALEKYLGDSDLLFYTTLNGSSTQEIKSRQNLDSYHYRITFSAHP